MTRDTGWFGEYGGRFVPETLVPALDELEAGWREAAADPSFAAELDALGREYAGRPTPLTLAERFLPGTRLYLKREDLLHTGAHKLNNALGQAVLARRLGKPRIVAETGAGQHGVAAATVCARFGLECVVYMGEEDMRRQRPNVERMGLLGAEVRPVDFGTRTLKEATSEAIRDWITNVRTTHYLIGSCVGPHPYPDHRPGAAGGDRPGGPRAVPRRRGTAAGSRRGVRRRAARTPSASSPASSRTATCASWAWRPPGPPASSRAAPASCTARARALLADADGQIEDAHSISAGLDYPGVGPEHALLRDSGRAQYVTATDDEALDAFRRLAETEGIIPALEPAHALARVADLDAEAVLVGLSGRGDKDLDQVLARSVKTLVVYLMAGRETPALAEAAVEGGADVIEIGFPFSDPLADGPVIRRAAEQGPGGRDEDRRVPRVRRRHPRAHRQADRADDVRVAARGVRLRALRGGRSCRRRHEPHRRRPAGGGAPRAAAHPAGRTDVDRRARCVSPRSGRTAGSTSSA